MGRAKRFPLYTFILLVVSLCLPSLFLIGFSSPADATLNANTDSFQITYKASSQGVLRTHQSGSTAGGIAISGNQNIVYSWDLEGTTPSNFTPISNATNRGASDTANTLRYIPIPATTWGADRNVTLTISQDPSTTTAARLYGFHGWQANIGANNSNTAVSSMPAYDTAVGLGEQLVEIRSFGNFANLTSLRGAFSEAPSTFLISAQLPTTVRSLQQSFQFSDYNSSPITLWDVSRVTNFSGSFNSARFFNQPIGIWNMSSATDLSNMFQGGNSVGVAFNQDVSGWDVSKVTNFSNMFNNAFSFNQPIGSWNTASATNLSGMFKGSGANMNFNQDISNWDVSKVSSFAEMFRTTNGSSFNQPIGNWNTSSAQSMNFMFNGATSFNQSINSWDVSRVVSFSGMFGFSGSSPAYNQPLNNWNPAAGRFFDAMFKGNTVFNQPIGNWNVSAGESFNEMFFDARAFNQDLSNWNIGSATNLVGMFSGTDTSKASVFNNGQTYVSSQAGVKPLSWDTRRVQYMYSMFENNTQFNQSVDGWDLKSLSYSPPSGFSQTPFLNYVFNNASGFNNGDAQGVSGVMDWKLPHASGQPRKNMVYLFRNASSFNQDTSSWDMHGQKDVQDIVTGALRFNQPIGHFRMTTFMTGSLSTALSFQSISQANYESSIIDWAYQPPLFEIPSVHANLHNRIRQFTTCLGNGAYSLLVTRARPLSVTNSLAGINPGGCVDRSVTWSEAEPYTSPQLVAGQTGVYRINPNSAASSLNSGTVKYMVISRDGPGDCRVDPTTGAVTYTVLGVNCTILAYTTSSDAQALSSVSKSFTTFAPAAYTVNFDYQSASGGNTLTTTTWRTGDAPLTLPTPTRTGYEFGGWFTSNTFTTPTGANYTPTSNITLFARFDSVITYDSRGGSAVSSVTVRATQSTSLNSSLTRAGYTFGGWFSSTSFTTRVPASGFSYTPTGSITLFANWTPNTLNVTYQTNLGSSISSTTTDITRSLAQPSNPTRTGYTFAGWFTDIGLTSEIPSWPYSHGQTTNFTLYAKWTPATLNVAFETNGGSSISSVTTDVTRSLSQPVSPTRAGYTFAGWFTNVGLSSQVPSWPYAHSQTSSFTLYAKWTANTLTVTYQTNGGSTVTNGSTTTGATISSAPTAPTRSGFNFVAWYEDSSFTTLVNWPYAHGKTEDFTLYAKWQSRAQSALQWNLSSTSVAYLGSLSLAVTGGSGTGSVSYAVSNNSTCTVSGSTLTPGAAGSICIVTATKAGDASFDSASTDAQVITVTKINQSALNWNLSSTSVAYRGSLSLATSGGSGSGAVVYSVGAGSDCSIVGTTLIPGDAGSLCQITATKVSDTNYNSADTSTQTITITKISQATLSFSNANTLTFGQAMDLLAIGGSGSGSVTYLVTSAGTTGCTLSGARLTVTAAGTCAVSATKAASTNYNISNTATLSITVSKATQTVRFTSTVPSEPIAGGTYSVTATSSSGIAASLSISSGNCSISGGTVTFTGAGNCVVQAVANSSSQYLQSDPVTQTIAVGQRNQTLSFDSAVQSITQKTYGDPAFLAEAFSSEAGLTLSYTLGSATTNSACAVTTNGIVIVLAVGICEIVVDQAGNSDVAAASTIRKSINIVPDQASAPYITSVSAGHESITAAFIKPTYLGGGSITGYQLVATSGSSTVTNSACTVNGSSSIQTCTVSGLTNGSSYRVKVAAITAAGLGLYSELSASRVPATNPAAVSALTAVPNNTVIDLTWLDPVSLGGGVFDSYRIFYKSSSESSYPNTYITVNSQSTRSYQITNLVNGESYDVKIVTVTQANTQSLISNTAEVKETPRTVPDSPATVEVIEVAGSLVITWSTPVSDGGNAITEYRVTVNGVDCTLTNALDKHCLASAPTSAGTHPVAVRAKNDAGFSTPAVTNFVKLGTSSTGGGGGEYSVSRGNFVEVHHINVSRLPATGGQVVKIRGRNLSGISTVTVGQFKARIISVSDNEIRFVAPRGIKGSAHLKLQGPSQSSEVKDAFLYFNGKARPAVRWVLGYIQAETQLSSEAKARLKRALLNKPETVSVSCIGYQSWYYDTPKDYQTVIGRAKEACDYLKSINPELQVRTEVARTNLTGTPSRKLSIQFRGFKLSKSSSR